MILRPRQEAFVSSALAALDKNGDTLGVAPTGSGKTVMLSATIKGLYEAGRAERTLVIQHRDELVAQNRATFHNVVGKSIASGVVDAKTKQFKHQVTFGMVQTLANIEALPEFDTVVIDEAHHSVAPTYIGLLDRIEPKTLFGVTATPNRGDRRGLGKVYSNVCDEIQLVEMIQAGHLVRPRTFSIDIGVREELRNCRKTAADFDADEVAKILDKPILREKIIEEWRRLAGDRQTVIFCSTVGHARHVSDAFLEAGVSTCLIHAKLSHKERHGLLSAYDRGLYQVAVNVAVLTEGWDHQPTSCVVLLRQSSYKSTMIQMIGRGLRVLDPERYPGRPAKRDCIVLDFGITSLTHGSLEDRADLNDRDPELAACPSCGGMIPVTSRECALCGEVLMDPVPDDDTVADETPVVLLGAEPKDPLEFTMTEIDLISKSPFRWEELFGGIVSVATAFDAWGMAVAYAGDWHAICGSKATGAHMIACGDRFVCMAAADDFLRAHGDRKAANKNKTWLHMPATSQQRGYLDGMVAPHETLTRYRAACMLTFRFNERNIRDIITRRFGKAA